MPDQNSTQEIAAAYARITPAQRRLLAKVDESADRDGVRIRRDTREALIRAGLIERDTTGQPYLTDLGQGVAALATQMNAQALEPAQDGELETVSNQEYAEDFAKEAQRSVATLTRELRDLADRLDQMAQAFASGRQSASSVAADVVSEFAQGTGGRGSRLWAIVHAAGQADQYRVRAEGDKP